MAPGETVRFVVKNTDPIDHEFFPGDQHLQDPHENGTEAYHPPRPGEMTIPAGTTRVTTHAFPRAPTRLFFRFRSSHLVRVITGVTPTTVEFDRLVDQPPAS